MEDKFDFPNEIPKCLESNVSLKHTTVVAMIDIAEAFSNFHKEKGDGKRSRVVFLTTHGFVSGDIMEIAERAEPRKTDLGYTVDVGTYLYHSRNVTLVEEEKKGQLSLSDATRFVHLKNVTFASLTNTRTPLDEMILFTDQILGMMIEQIDTE